MQMRNRTKKFFRKSKKRKLAFKGNKLFFQGEEVKTMQEYDAYCFLSGEEEKAFEELKERISKFNLYCTFGEFDRLLNNVILTGNSLRFIETLESFAKENPADNYLLNGRTFYIARIKRSPF